jgi:lipid II:glycine glycyltransferase (peptidoglycan interpeptide bridge formation enzyme)
VASIDPSGWDTFIESRGGHLLQTSLWGRLKAAFGWSYEIVALPEGSSPQAGALILFRRLPLGLGTLAYIPRGPLVDWQDRQQVTDLLAACDSACRRHRAVCLKIEPDAQDNPALQSELRALGFRPSPHTIQPPNTVILDAGDSDEALLARMNQGTRRKIRQSDQREVSVRHGTSADVESFNALSAITGARDGFGVHSPDYYKTAFDLFAPHHASLLIASYGGKDMAGLMLFWLGKRAWYFYGASSNDERDRMPNYALQWAAIQHSRTSGCTEYDLWGIPDADEHTLEAQFQRRSEGLWGVYGFKRGFGGRVVRSVGAWDRVYNGALYSLYTAFVRRTE